MKTILTQDPEVRSVLETCEPSYAETIGTVPQDSNKYPRAIIGLEAPFDWVEALSDSNPEWGDLKLRAACWPTCACGNQCIVLERNDLGVPIDSLLFSLGMQFSERIQARDSKGALEVLIRIEKRSAVLINRHYDRKSLNL